MKRFLSLALFIIVILAVCVLLLKHKSQLNPTATQLELVKPPSEVSKTDDIKMAAIEPQPAIPTTIQTNNSASQMLNAFSAENIEEWKAAITNLRSDPAIKGNWTMWQSYTNPGVPIKIGSVKFDSDLVNIYTRRDNSGNIRSVEIHSVWMNIEDTKSLGDSLLQMMGKDTTSFDAWCDKVGNNWVDAPLFTSGGSRMPDSNKFYGFATYRTFNNEKPWYILFFITDP